MEHFYGMDKKKIMQSNMQVWIAQDTPDQEDEKLQLNINVSTWRYVTSLLRLKTIKMSIGVEAKMNFMSSSTLDNDT